MTRIGVPMRGAAAKCVYEDSPHQPLHTVKVLHLDPATQVTPDDVRRHLQARVDVLPLLRRTLRLPRVGAAWWVELSHVEVGAHLAHRTVAEGEAARDAAVADELARVLPRDRPLWRVLLLDAPDGQALVLSASHALLDGELTSRLLVALFGPDPEPWPEEARPLPSRLAEHLALLPVPVRLATRSVRAARRARREGLPAGTAPFSGSGAPWNAHVPTAERGYAELVLPLADVQAVARAGGATFTALVLALAGGAVRAVAGPPGSERDLLAAVPAGVRRLGDSPTAVEVTDSYFVPVGATVADPRERLAAVTASLAAAKARSALDPRFLYDSWDLWSLLSRVNRVAGWVGRRWLGRPSVSLVVSTVRGPAGPLHVAGSAVGRVVSGGILRDDIGLNVTVWSSGDLVTFGVTGRPALVDVHRVAAELAAAYDELTAAHGLRAD